MLNRITELLRQELLKLHQNEMQSYHKELESLQNHSTFKGLGGDKQESLLCTIRQFEPELPSTGGVEEIRKELQKANLQARQNRLYALPEKFRLALLEATKVALPAARVVTLPGRTLNTEEDVKAWVEETMKLLLKELKSGPIII